MLEHISWKDFAIFLAGGCIAYYGIMLVTGKLKLTGKERSGRQSPSPASEHLSEDNDDDGTIITQPDQQDETEFETLELLANELQVIIVQSKAENSSKDELMELLRKEIIGYPELNNPAFRMAINNLITRTSQQERDMEISRQEAEELWFTD